MIHRTPAITLAVAAVMTAAMACAQNAAVLKGAAAFGDYSSDKPGLTRHISAADLPAPNSAESVRNTSQVDARPQGAMPLAPPGFSVSEYTDQLQNPRTLRVAPNGDVFVAESNAGRVRVLRPGTGGKPAAMEVFAEGLRRPFGINFFPPGNDPQWVYVGENNEVKRYPYRSGDLKARAAAETVIAPLTDTSGGHATRDIVFTRDGSRLLVSVGSQSNYAEGLMQAKGPAELAAWEKQHGLGASWGAETDRATVLSYTPDGKDRRVFATGIRNCVGLARNPATGDIYCATNERDALGHDLVPDYLSRVREGQFFGWPWYYIGSNEEPRLAGQRPDLKGKVTVPDVLFQAHSAALHTAFYPVQASGGSAFPADYRGDAFVTLHGSWNRAPRTGYKVVRVKLRNGIPTGEYQDFVTGFVIDAQKVWGRPVGVAVLQDGSLLFSDDGGNRIWRVSYTGQAVARN